MVLDSADPPAFVVNHWAVAPVLGVLTKSLTVAPSVSACMLAEIRLTVTAKRVVLSTLAVAVLLA